MKLLMISFCLVACTFLSSACDQHPVVHAPVGKVRGSILTTRLGKNISAFRGVRYAEAPTGSRRFRPPVPVVPWKNTFDASEEGPSCPSLGGEQISEDCLRLNVYTTKLPSKNEAVKRPVIVFFHPGGYYAFSGQSFNFGPQYMMDKNVVLVTANYRLGTLGFISTGDAEAPGNLGLKDQVQALRWVKNNIAAFGGDPNSVTISGYSVGGLSVMLHMLSPMSKNLFHKVISMSGSTLTTEPYPTQQKHLAKKQADFLGCPSTPSQAMLSCLRSKPVENFTDTMESFFEWNGDPILVWEPVVEPKVDGIETFLPDQPATLIKTGNFHQVPAIFGVTKDEFGGVSVYFDQEARAGNDSLYRELDERWNTLAPICFLYERETARSTYLSHELKQFYFKGQPINIPTRQGLADIYADSVIIFPVYRSAKLIATNSKKPVYFYKFTYQGRKSFAMWNETTPYGVAHHDDLQYLFFMNSSFPFLEKDAPENAMVDMYTSMWTNFAKTGKPVPKNDDKFKNVVWNKLVPAQSNYLDISLTPTMKNGFFAERMQEWEKLFPLDYSPVSHT